MPDGQDAVTICIDPNHPELGNQTMTPMDAVRHYAHCISVLCDENWRLKKELSETRTGKPSGGEATDA